MDEGMKTRYKGDKVFLGIEYEIVGTWNKNIVLAPVGKNGWKLDTESECLLYTPEELDELQGES